MEETKNTNKTISDSSRAGIKTIQATAMGIEVVNRKVGNRLATNTDAIDKELKVKFEDAQSLIEEDKGGGINTSVEQSKKLFISDKNAVSDKSVIRTKIGGVNTNASQQQVTVGNNNMIKTSINQGMPGSNIEDSQFETSMHVIKRGKISRTISGVTKTTIIGAKVASKFVGMTRLIGQATTGDSNQAVMDAVKRKTKKTAVKTSTKVVMKPTKYIVKKITKKPVNYLKKKAATVASKLLIAIQKIARAIISKIIVAVVSFIIGCGAVIIPCAAGIAVLVMVFGGGSGQTTMDKYESYILSINEEYRYGADYIRKTNSNVQTDSFDGTYGRIDWRAFLSIIQALRGDLDFGVEEVILLDQFKSAGLYEKQQLITEGENYVLKITNSSLPAYEQFINDLFVSNNAYMCRLTGRKQEQITDDQKELIDALYSSEDLFSTFSPALQQFATMIDPSTGNSLSGIVVTGDSETGNAIAKKALTKTGFRYWWGAPGGGFGDKQKLDDPNAAYFDCSGFVAWSYRQSGVKLDRTTASGYSKSGLKVEYADMQAGDVITFSYDKGKSVSHIGIYIGGGKMVHAAGDGSTTLGQYANQCVMVSPITTDSYYYQYIFNCRRLY